MTGHTLLAVTPGEPAGVGPECALRLAHDHPELALVFIADAAMLGRAARRLGLAANISQWTPGQPLATGTVNCLHVELDQQEEPGRLNPANGPYVLECLRSAVGLVQDGMASALVTGPVHKGVINDAGIPFTGHTEFLATLGGAERVVMMLAADSLRVALATTHLPLRAVPDAITGESLAVTLRILDRDLKSRFGIARPRIQVLGLNPHAGESGHLGHEEDEIIRPTIVQSVQEGIAAFGPVPADTAFTPPALEACDVVLAMYHDQGLPVLKHAGFGRAVNITLGLPFIRTSVDHGTALDIAGEGRANPDSFWHAARMARHMSRGDGK